MNGNIPVAKLTRELCAYSTWRVVGMSGGNTAQHRLQSPSPSTPFTTVPMPRKCLSTLRNAQNIQTNWASWVKHAWAQSTLLVLHQLGKLTFCLFVVGFVTQTCIIVIARDSVITAGTPWSHHSSCAALKTQPVGVDRRNSWVRFSRSKIDSHCTTIESSDI